MNNNLRELRKFNELSLEELSKDLEKLENFKISPDAIAKYERGDREPKLATWEKLANYFNVNISYIQGTSEIKDKDILKHPKKFFNYCQEKYGTQSNENNDQFILINKQEIPNLFKEQNIINANNLFQTFGKDEMNISENDLQKYQKTFMNMKNENMSKISDIYFFLSNIFYAYMESENGNKKSMDLTKEIEEIMNKYLNIDNEY